MDLLAKTSQPHSNCVDHSAIVYSAEQADEEKGGARRSQSKEEAKIFSMDADEEMASEEIGEDGQQEESDTAEQRSLQEEFQESGDDQDGAEYANFDDDLAYLTLDLVNVLPDDCWKRLLEIINARESKIMSLEKQNEALREEVQLLRNTIHKNRKLSVASSEDTRSEQSWNREGTSTDPTMTPSSPCLSSFSPFSSIPPFTPPPCMEALAALAAGVDSLIDDMQLVSKQSKEALAYNSHWTLDMCQEVSKKSIHEDTAFHSAEIQLAETSSAPQEKESQVWTEAPVKQEEAESIGEVSQILEEKSIMFDVPYAFEQKDELPAPKLLPLFVESSYNDESRDDFQQDTKKAPDTEAVTYNLLQSLDVSHKESKQTACHSSEIHPTESAITPAEKKSHVWGEIAIKEEQIERISEILQDPGQQTVTLDIVSHALDQGRGDPLRQNLLPLFDAPSCMDTARKEINDELLDVLHKEYKQVEDEQTACYSSEICPKENAIAPAEQKSHVWGEIAMKEEQIERISKIREDPEEQTVTLDIVPFTGDESRGDSLRQNLLPLLGAPSFMDTAKKEIKVELRDVLHKESKRVEDEQTVCYSSEIHPTENVIPPAEKKSHIWNERVFEEEQTGRMSKILQDPGQQTVTLDIVPYTLDEGKRDVLGQHLPPLFGESACPGTARHEIKAEPINQVGQSPREQKIALGILPHTLDEGRSDFLGQLRLPTLDESACMDTARKVPKVEMINEVGQYPQEHKINLDIVPYALDERKEDLFSPDRPALLDQSFCIDAVRTKEKVELINDTRQDAEGRTHTLDIVPYSTERRDVLMPPNLLALLDKEDEKAVGHSSDMNSADLAIVPYDPEQRTSLLPPDLLALLGEASRDYKDVKDRMLPSTPEPSAPERENSLLPSDLAALLTRVAEGGCLLDKN